MTVRATLDASPRQTRRSTADSRCARWARRIVLAVIVLAPLQMLSAQGSEAARASQEIRRLRAESNAAIARHDTAGIARTFAPNVVVVASTSSQTVGRDANARVFAEIFQARPDVTYRRTPDAVEVFVPWHMASERGRWVGSWSDADGKVTVGGTYFAKWRVLDGAWKIESETFVPDRCDGAKYCEKVP